MKKLLFFKTAPIVFALLVVLAPSLLFAGEVILIANRNVPDDSLTKEEVKAIFLGEKTKWNDNSRVTFVVLKSPEEMDTFMKHYVGKSSFQFDNYWKYQTFTGKGSPPRAFENPGDLINFVAGTEGAVGYVAKGTPIDNVKEIAVK